MRLDPFGLRENPDQLPVPGLLTPADHLRRLQQHRHAVPVGGLKLVREVEDRGDRRIRPRIRLREQCNLLTEPRRNAAHILHPSAFEPIL
jgi:hypothetical protein